MKEYQKEAGSLFMQLAQPPDRVQCMHVYIDGTLRNFRTKDRTWPHVPQSPDEFERLEFCGSATDFDVGNEADYYARPVRLYRDPFRLGDNKILFCDTYNNKGQPTFANNRYRLLSLKQSLKEAQVQFVFHQPYTLLRKDGHHLGHMDIAFDPESNTGFACGREVAESHYKACLYAGVGQSSLETVDHRGQWRYSISGSSLVDMCDDVWASRFLLQRVGEDFGVPVNWDTRACPRLAPLYCSIALRFVEPDHVKKMFEQLSTKFVKESPPVKITSSSAEVVISGFPAEMDPYSIACKVLENANS